MSGLGMSVLLEGKVKDRAEAVIELLEEIGVLPDVLKEQIMSQTDLDVLKKWHKAAAKAKTIDDFEDVINPENATEPEVMAGS